IEVPGGFPGVTPGLGLSYGSGAGAGLAGIGWSLDVASIERRTLHGLPAYDADDEFVADGSEQLVRVSASGGDAVYRARFEGGFVRYTFHDAGAAGYWTAEYPDGRIGTFGAAADGELVADARTAGESGQTFRYHLVEMVDLHGHRMVYDYEHIDGAPYCVGIRYVFSDGGVARYEVK